ncbi:CDP-alcohol phosphatidyltransferase family protein [Rhizobium leguminosarum]|uniref:CDP-alcohol phosphatidyltransferase family protein n=1 Tax=Rhizobium leguminosarum TaxID=384 RepID=UPI0021BBDD8C|nr:CDP-alcohol phosphatidyltransferase family protein [Rhizobium leguminosarum]
MWDTANAITLFGIVCSALAINFALVGALEFAVSLALISMLADQLDGIVARAARGRSADIARMGKSLDGFADIIYGAIFPAVAIMTLQKGAAIAPALGIVLLLAGAIRLSYFENFGLSVDGRFLGVPLSYDVPVLAILLLARPLLGVDFLPVVAATFVVLACLHVAPIRVPSPSRIMYYCIIAFCITVSPLLIIIGLS